MKELGSATKLMLLPLGLSLAIFGAGLYANAKTNREARYRKEVAVCCETDAQLVARIMEDIDGFIKEPEREQELGGVLIRSVERWHQYWHNAIESDAMVTTPMSSAEENGMRDRFDVLFVHCEKLLKETRRRSADPDFDGDTQLYDRMLDLIGTNPLPEDN